MIFGRIKDEEAAQNAAAPPGADGTPGGGPSQPAGSGDPGGPTGPIRTWRPTPLPYGCGNQSGKSVGIGMIFVATGRVRRCATDDGRTCDLYRYRAEPLPSLSPACRDRVRKLDELRRSIAFLPFYQHQIDAAKIDASRADALDVWIGTVGAFAIMVTFVVALPAHLVDGSFVGLIKQGVDAARNARKAAEKTRKIVAAVATIRAYVAAKKMPAALAKIILDNATALGTTLIRIGQLQEELGVSSEATQADVEALATAAVAGNCPLPAGRYPAGTVARFNVDRSVFSIYVPKELGLGRALAAAGDPPLPEADEPAPTTTDGRATVKSAEEAGQPAGVPVVGSEHDKRPFWKKPLFWVAAVGTTAVVGGGIYVASRRAG